jgi:DNA replication protein DnaC
MLKQQTIEKLYDMRLSAMAEAFHEQGGRKDVLDLSFDERFGLLIEKEWQVRQERRLTRRLKQADLKQRACIEDIDYRHKRGLDKEVMLELITCDWIRVSRNLIITGATGLGKSWLSCALADQACRLGFTAMYRRVPQLTYELTLARADGTYLKQLNKLAKTNLLVLDDWGLTPLEGQAQHDVLDVVDERVGKRSTIVTSQFPVAKWHDTVGDPSVADALLDRLVNGATKIKLKGKSLRGREE